MLKGFYHVSILILAFFNVMISTLTQEDVSMLVRVFSFILSGMFLQTISYAVAIISMQMNEDWFSDVIILIVSVLSIIFNFKFGILMTIICLSYLCINKLKELLMK